VGCCISLCQVFPSTLDQTKMEGESPYNVMFGPDICGPGTKKVHVIFSYKGKNLLVKKDIRCKVCFIWSGIVDSSCNLLL